LLSLFILAACGNKKTTPEKSVIVQPDSKTVTAQATENPGKKVYDSVCLACHMRDGSGVPGMHPPLIESEFVNGDPGKLITIILKGLSGKIEIQGEIYNSIMPPQANLSDKQIADVLTYIRSNFGNNSSAISMEQVQKIRADN
jgi:mono/diheme cytochrome c family protein